MATTRCPNCSTEIRRPSRILGFILGALTMVFVGVPMLIVACIAALVAIGSNASDTFSEIADQANGTMEVQQDIDDILAEIY